MNKEAWEDYLKLASEITEKLDNTATYESWLIIQEYVDRCQERNQKHKEAINKAFELLQLLHYKLDFNNSIHNEIEDIQKILKEVE